MFFISPFVIANDGERVFQIFPIKSNVSRTDILEIIDFNTKSIIDYSPSTGIRLIASTELFESSNARGLLVNGFGGDF